VPLYHVPRASLRKALFCTRSPGIVVESISTADLAALLKSDPASILLLDVREDDERSTAVIEPSAHIPMNSVPDRLAELPRDRRIVVYCHHGNRSYAVAGYLETEGFERVANLTGGIDEWSRLIDSSVPRY
jgi:rhodanese-related sulfurtransferase